MSEHLPKHQTSTTGSANLPWLLHCLLSPVSGAAQRVESEQLLRYLQLASFARCVRHLTGVQHAVHGDHLAACQIWHAALLVVQISAVSVSLQAEHLVGLKISACLVRVPRMSAWLSKVFH